MVLRGCVAGRASGTRHQTLAAECKPDSGAVVDDVVGWDGMGCGARRSPSVSLWLGQIALQDGGRGAVCSVHGAGEFYDATRPHVAPFAASLAMNLTAAIPRRYSRPWLSISPRPGFQSTSSDAQSDCNNTPTALGTPSLSGPLWPLPLQPPPSRTPSPSRRLAPPPSPLYLQATACPAVGSPHGQMMLQHGPTST